MGKILKFFLILTILLFSYSVFSESEVTTSFSFETSFEEEDFLKLGKKFALNAGLGTVAYSYYNEKTGKRETEYLPKITAYPTLQIPPLSVGLEVSYLIAEKEKKEKLKDTGKNPVIFKYLQYDKKPVYARWGVLDHITLGHGFIMNNYSTSTTYRSTVYTNKDKGVRVKYTPEKFGIDVVSTQTHVYGVRVHSKITEKITLGATYVTDGDETEDITVYGLDAEMPVFSKMSAYLDWAKIEDAGQGFVVGTRASLGKKISWINEYRSVDEDFKPGIFDAHYETDVAIKKETGQKLTIPKTKNDNGFLSQLNIDIIEQLKATISYEDYNKSEPRIIGIAKFAVPSPGLPGNIRGYISYEQKNLREKGVDPKYGIVKGELATPVSKNLDMVVNYTQTYQPEKLTSVHYSFRFKF